MILDEQNAPFGNYSNSWWNPLRVLESNYVQTSGAGVITHELGHNMQFPTPQGEMETVVQLVGIPMYNVGLNQPIDTATSYVEGEKHTRDMAAINWMIAYNFRNNNPMKCDSTMDAGVCSELRYQIRGGMKYIDIAMLYGWDSLGLINKIFYDQWTIDGWDESDAPFITSEQLIQAATEGIGENITPLLHFWGYIPSESQKIELDAYPKSERIFERLLYYKELAPKTKDEFQVWYDLLRPTMDPVHYDRYDWTLANFDIENIGQAISDHIDFILNTYNLIIQETTENISLCSGEDYTYPDGTTETNITVNTSHESILTSQVTGLDSIVTTNITVNAIYAITEDVTLYSGDDYIYPDGTTEANVTANTVHISNLFSAITGCDSTITTNITVIETYSFNYNGHDYDIIKDAKSWVDAAAFADAMGGYLIEINDQSEQDAIYDTITNASGISSTYTSVNDGGGIAYIWIGASDQYIEGTWIWDGDGDNVGTHFWTGQGMAGANNGVVINNIYNNWGTGSSGAEMEPDNYNNNQNAAAIGLAGWPSFNPGMLGSSGQWNDINSDNQLYFVMEFDCKSSNTVDVQTACGSYTWIDGNTYTQSGNTATHTLTSVNGCDSVITLNLTVNPVYSITENETICSGDDYTYPDGSLETNITANTSHISNLSSINGCDSTVTTNIFVNKINTNVNVNGNILTADNIMADAYQWFDCNLSLPISGETNYTFTATETGNYAVAIEDNNCLDTSACNSIIISGIEDVENMVQAIYPNPTSGQINIRLTENKEPTEISIFDVSGKLILQKGVAIKETEFTTELLGESGIYFVQVKSDSKIATYKIIKK
jgi:hypothetical protein